MIGDERKSALVVEDNQGCVTTLLNSDDTLNECVRVCQRGLRVDVSTTGFEFVLDGGDLIFRVLDE